MAGSAAAPTVGRAPGRRLVEPFCGGLAVALGLMPSTALLNDVNPHVINLYRWLGRGLRITFAMKNESTSYYASRHRFNELLQAGDGGTAEAASLFYYLNRTGYNGLCRFNRTGRLQRAVRPLQEDRLPHRLHRVSAGVLAFRVHADGFREAARCVPTISSTPIRRTTSSSPSTRAAVSDGTNRRAPPNGWRRIPVRSSCPTSAPIGSRSSTGNWASPSPSRPPLVSSAAPATGPPRRKCSPRAISVTLSERGRTCRRCA